MSEYIIRYNSDRYPVQSELYPLEIVVRGTRAAAQWVLSCLLASMPGSDHIYYLPEGDEAAH